MAGGQERILRRRIKSVAATRKITKAMELIAASQIAKSQARIAQNRPYRNGMKRIIVEAALGDPAVAKKMLIAPENVSQAVVLVISGDRGKKAPGFFRFRGMEVEQSFVGFADRPAFVNAREVARAVAAPFTSGEAQQVHLVSTKFLSAGSQSVSIEQLLPLSMPETVVDDAPKKLKGYTEFEPEVEQLLTFLAPRAIESEIFTALLEGAASFHSSQQRAMAAATDNADELGQTLSRIMNRARQDSITTEIMEIVSGAEALRSGK